MGGLVSAYPYPGLDSAIWRSTSRAPALDRVIAFGPEDGYLAAVDTSGSPVRIDLRVGSVAISRKAPLKRVSSADGAEIYALTTAGEITRFTPSGGDWTFRPTFPADAIYAQADGSVIVAGARDKRVLIWRIRPPGQRVSDSLSVNLGGAPAALSHALASTAGMSGDRVYFGANESVVAIRARDLAKVLDVNLGDPIVSIAATPSGDRLFVALAGQTALRVVDRFEEGVTGTVRLPTSATALRMDPLGRVLLARGNGDSVFVVSLATDKITGVVHTEWRGDLPLVLPDGVIALARGTDVMFADPSTLADGRRVKGGARDFWHVLRWNGFRPRAAGLDEPVQFRRSAPRNTVDADTIARVDAGALPPAVPPLLPIRPEPRMSPARDSTFTVSFAALLDEQTARALASRIRVDGQVPRITASDRAGKTLYRVVLGPYPTREVAERVGRTSGHSYWVFEGAP